MSRLPALLASALLGAMIGFAPFNRPVARLFLGDVGSLPIGLLLGWLLLHSPARGHLAAALILPLYYLADATVTLARRIARGEPFWQAHRTHFYQRATDNGFTVPEIVTHVALSTSCWRRLRSSPSRHKIWSRRWQRLQPHSLSSPGCLELRSPQALKIKPPRRRNPAPRRAARCRSPQRSSRASPAPASRASRASLRATG